MKSRRSVTALLLLLLFTGARVLALSSNNPRRCRTAVKKETLKSAVSSLLVCATMLAASVAGATAPVDVVRDVASVMEREFFSESTVRSDAWRDARRQAVAAAMETDDDADAARIVADLLKASSDPYTRFLPSVETLEKYKAAPPSGGLGIRLSADDPRRVVEVLESSPAQGFVQAGDMIEAVGGVVVEKATTSAVISAMRGDVGSRVTLRLRGRNNIELTRAVLPSPPEVEIRGVSSLNGQTVGSMAVRLFSLSTASAVEKAAVEMNADALLIDLRGNGGGALQGGVDTAALFLPSKTLIATLRSRDAPDSARISQAPRFPNARLWLLTDGGTASAAELFAAALQETGRAEVLGEATYGKARVQRVVDLPGGGALLLTRQTYLTPRGRDLTGAGVKPDLPVDCKTTETALTCLDNALRSRRDE